MSSGLRIFTGRCDSLGNLIYDGDVVIGFRDRTNYIEMVRAFLLHGDPEIPNDRVFTPFFEKVHSYDLDGSDPSFFDPFAEFEFSICLGEMDDSTLKRAVSIAEVYCKHSRVLEKERGSAPTPAESTHKKKIVGGKSK